ncbi:GNAT family N-acetyltransferase [Virgibacillus sp. W0430]|uniref:GNAT family N-acetyltransferase n=1 Tax=Virgibacillus sp. W0430 TaxID=3391580 RepID=UPI003F47EF3F
MQESEFHLKSIQTKNLIFRELTVEDTEDIYTLYSDSEVLQLDNREPIKYISEAESLIRTFQQANLSYHSINWGTELKSTNKIIGTCGFKRWDRISHHSEIGGNISSLYWGNHYGTEMLHFLLNYGFNKMDLNKIYACTNRKNTRVRALLEKFNFKTDGRLRDHQLVNNLYEDVLLFSKLKNEHTVP